MSGNAEVLTISQARPCPFCGAAAEIERWHGGDTRHTRRVGCSNDRCPAMPGVTGKTRALALRAWNRRSGDDYDDDDFDPCVHCGERLTEGEHQYHECEP